MRIANYLRPDCVALRQRADSLTGAVQQMFTLLDGTDNLTDTAVFAADVRARLALGGVCVGNGLAIPHAKSTAVRQLQLAALTLEKGAQKQSIYRAARLLVWAAYILLLNWRAGAMRLDADDCWLISVLGVPVAGAVYELLEQKGQVTAKWYHAPLALLALLTVSMAALQDMRFILLLVGLGVAFLASFKVQKDARAILWFACAFSNAGYMGFPLIKALFGGEGLLYASGFVTIFNILICLSQIFLNISNLI